MAIKKASNGKVGFRKIKMTSLEIVICYVATLILAGFIADSRLESHAVWGFLGVAIGLLFGKVSI